MECGGSTAASYEFARGFTRALGRTRELSQQYKEIVVSDIKTLLVEVDGDLAGYVQLRSGVIPEYVTGVGSDARTDRILVRPLSDG